MIKIPPKLIESYKNKYFGIYIGAGMSRDQVFQIGKPF